MPKHARVWVYASNKPIAPLVCEQIKAEAKHFATEWISHNNPVKADADVLYNSFVVFMVDESYNEVGGCSIDKSTQFIKAIEQKFDLNFFDRLKVQVLFENDSVASYNKLELQNLINEGKINEEIKVFNNVVTSKEDFDNQWIIPLKNLWINKSLKPLQISR